MIAVRTVYVSSSPDASARTERTRRTRLLAEHYLWGPEEALSTEEQAMAQDELQRVLDAAEHLPELSAILLTRRPRSADRRAPPRRARW